ncbi:MAG: hypothetical protein M1834_004768 [Cirrosporium novae-zelandiae]|nr:MAG: hypothetical protein M1834_004768 [Cirrosporium novae-zelandiae]
MIRFNDFPRELRDMVYHLCLYRGSIHPHRTRKRYVYDAPIVEMRDDLDDESNHSGDESITTIPDSIEEVQSEWYDSDPVNLAVLGLDRATRAEALEVYLGKNLVVFGCTTYMCDNKDNYQCHKFFMTDERLKYMKRLQLDYTYLELTTEDRHEIDVYSMNSLNFSEQGYLGHSEEERHRTLHKNRRAGLIHCVAVRIGCLFHYTNQSLLCNLNQVVLNIATAFCPDLCCRPLQSVILNDFVDIYRLLLKGGGKRRTLSVSGIICGDDGELLQEQFHDKFETTFRGGVKDIERDYGVYDPVKEELLPPKPPLQKCYILKLTVPDKKTISKRRAKIPRMRDVEELPCVEDDEPLPCMDDCGYEPSCIGDDFVSPISESSSNLEEEFQGYLKEYTEST